MPNKPKTTKPKPKGKKPASKPVESYRHESSDRPNLPTAQTEPFMGVEDRAPTKYEPPVRSPGKVRLSWDRSPDLDEVVTEAYPLFIHEKIHPAAFVESLQAGVDSKQDSLFHAFNNLPENATYEWYQHTGNWQNRVIRGESRRVMASLVAKEGMAGKVQMIFFDPPYGVGFKSNMQVSTRRLAVPNSKEAIPNEPEFISAFRDSYTNGIHGYIDNIYRIALHARDLLAESGSFFLQIGSDNVHRLAVVLDEVFGKENHVATISFAKSGSTSSSTLSQVADYLLWYARDADKVKSHSLYEPLNRKEIIEHMSWHAMVELSDGTTRKLTEEERLDPDKNLPAGARLYRRMPLTSQGESITGRSEPYVWKGVTCPCPPSRQWSVSHEGLDRLAELKRLDSAGEKSELCWKWYEEEIPGKRINNLWSQPMSPNDLHYVVETSEKAVERCILMTTDPGDLVIDPTCGSGTTAYVAEKWGRRWITIDVGTIGVSLVRQRLATGIFDYYLLHDTQAGAAKDDELNLSAGIRSKQKSTPAGDDAHDPASGFIYERTPAISAAVLAYDQQKPPRLLVNQPVKKSGVVRVCSPFTVESQSPYRYIAPAEAREFGNAMAATPSIIESLMRNGVAKPDGGRWLLENIEEHQAGTGKSLITHTAEAKEDGGNYENVQIAVAPDDCTVSHEFIRQAAQEAVKGTDYLLVIGFAFEADQRGANQEKLGRLTVMKVQAHRDLQIGNLAENAQHQALVLLGEPCVQIHPAGEDLIIAEIQGYDTYDPSTGQLAGGKQDQIDCWMIDTDYDGNSFFARRIHFPGKNSDRQINRFKRELGARIDPQLWEAMLSTKSAPFPKPTTGKIAVRIITVTHTEMATVIDIE